MHRPLPKTARVCSRGISGHMRIVGFFILLGNGTISVKTVEKYRFVTLPGRLWRPKLLDTSFALSFFSGPDRLSHMLWPAFNSIPVLSVTASFLMLLKGGRTLTGFWLKISVRSISYHTLSLRVSPWCVSSMITRRLLCRVIKMEIEIEIVIEIEIPISVLHRNLRWNTCYDLCLDPCLPNL